MKPGPSVRRLHDGSVIVGRQVGRAFVPSGRPLAAVLRCGAALWASGPVLDLLHQSPGWIVGGTCAWCVAAWRAEPAVGPTDEQAAPTDVTATPEHTDTEVYDGIVDYLRRLIADRNGVHLNEALNGLQAQRLVGHVVSVAEFGRQLVARGIPVRASLKVAGQVGPGVHRDDLPALPQSLPEAAHAVAG